MKIVKIKTQYRVDIVKKEIYSDVYVMGYHDFIPKTFDIKQECFNWISKNGNNYEYTITEIYSVI